MYNFKSPFVKSESDNKKIPVIKSGKSKPKKFAEGTSSVSDGGNPNKKSNGEDKKAKKVSEHNNKLAKKYGFKVPDDRTEKFSEKDVKEWARKKANTQYDINGRPINR
jgi:hypothetical protein